MGVREPTFHELRSQCPQAAQKQSLQHPVQEGIAVQRMWDTSQGYLQDDGEIPVEEYHSLQRSVLILRTDSSAAKAMMCKVGIGKTKHIAISLLWVQQWVQQRRVRIRSVSTWVNPTDLFTKQLAIRRVALLLSHESGDLSGRATFQVWPRGAVPGTQQTGEANDSEGSVSDFACRKCSYLYA